MNIDDLMCLEYQLCEIIDEHYDLLPDRGTSAWDVRKVNLINAVQSLLQQVEVDE